MITKKSRAALALVKNHAAMRRKWEALADKTMHAIQQIDAMTEGGTKASLWWSDMMDIHDQLEILRHIGPLQLMRDITQERVKFEDVKVFRVGSFRDMAEIRIREKPTADDLRASIQKGLDDYYGVGKIGIVEIFEDRFGVRRDIVVRIRAAKITGANKSATPVADTPEKKRAPLTAAQQNAFDRMSMSGFRSEWYTAMECRCSIATMRALERKGYVQWRGVKLMGEPRAFLQWRIKT